MKYEHQYPGACWDWLFFEGADDDISITVFMKNNYGVSIDKPEEFANQLITLFGKMHEAGIIRPENRAPDAPIDLETIDQAYREKQVEGANQ